MGFQADHKAEPIAENGALFPIERDRKFGYIDRTGKTVVEPRFTAAKEFREGRARVKAGGREDEDQGKWGYIDTRGTPVIETRFEYAEDFCEGLASVTVAGDHGYIDRAGRIVIKPQFDSARAFSEGLAVIELQGKYGYIDKDGVIVVEPKYDFADDFSGGLGLVEADGKYGFVDKTGQIAIPLQFEEACPFSEGLALINVNGKAGYVNRAGDIAIPPEFDSLWDQETRCCFRQGLAAVWRDGEPLYIDATGRPAVTNPAFQHVFPFVDGLARVTTRFDSELSLVTGFIDRSGNFVVQPTFGIAWDFSEGLARVRLRGDSTYGYIDNAGRLVIEPSFDEAEDFSGGLARVRIEEQTGYIDKKGNWLWGCEKYRGWHQITEITLVRKDESGVGFPEYAASIQADGTVTVIGTFPRAWTSTHGETSEDSPGRSEYKGTIAAAAFDRLAKLIHVSDFFGFDDSYKPRFAWGGRAPDRVTLTVRCADKVKSVTHYDFSDCGPIELWGIENAIDGVISKARLEVVAGQDAKTPPARCR